MSYIDFLKKVTERADAAAANNWELADKIDAEIAPYFSKYGADDAVKFCQGAWLLAKKIHG